MMTPIPTGVPGFGYGLGLTVVEMASGRLVGQDGIIPGFLSVDFSSEDGHRQFGVISGQARRVDGPWERPKHLTGC
jgi:hypothetical protein